MKYKTILLAGLTLILIMILPQLSLSAPPDKLERPLRVSVYENSPKIFTDADGRVSGLWADIINHIAAQEGWEVQYVPGDWAQGLTRLENNQIDIMVDVALSAKREKIYDFNNETILINWAMIYARQGVAIESFFDLGGKKVTAMARGIHYSGPLGIVNLLKSFQIEAEFVPVEVYGDVFELLNKGEADAGVVNRIFGITNAPKYPNIKPTNIVFNPIELRFALTKNSPLNPYLISRLDFHLKELKEDKDSIYYASIRKHLKGTTEEIEIFPGWIKQVLFIISLLAFFFIGCSMILKKRVKTRTFELREANRKLQEDIIERKRLESEKEQIQDQFLQSQKMEAIGSLAGGVAHDFNNLLTVIRGYAELAMTKTDQKDSLFDDLENILQSAHQASDLTRQLLLFARKQVLEFTPFSLNTAINNLNKMLRRLIGEDISIQAKLADDLWTLKADKGSINQAIMNMAVNARDAMPRGGAITIQTANVTIDEDYCHTHVEARPGQFVCLSISDTGTGMDKETIQHIFEPFFTTKETAKGTGLGLSVIFGIIKQHQGWINVYSEPACAESALSAGRPGHGTIFRIYLPADPRLKLKTETEKPAASKPTQTQGERILVVEDEAPVLKLATKVLKKQGYTVFTACTLKEAEALFKKEQGDFHLIFSDTILPDGIGPELVERLCKDQPGLRVLISSGYTDDKAHKTVIEQKKYPFLQKPYGINQMLSAVREAIDAGK